MPQCTLGNVKFHIEIPMMLLFYAFMVAESVNTNLILFRTCYVTLGYNETICQSLISNLTDNSTRELEEKVQISASYIITLIFVLENILPTILCLFFGPWSDKYGRKPLMIMTLSAFIAGYLGKTAVSAIPTLSPWFLIISSFAAVITGGFATYFTAVLCYITDVTTVENRGMRMGLYEATLALGVFLGTVSSSYVFNAVGFTGTFLTSAGCIGASLLYTIVFLPETIQNEDSLKSKLRDIFNTHHIISMLKTTFKKRENYQRAILMIVIAMIVINILNLNGDTSVIYLYIREKFHWDLRHYTLYTAGKSVSWVVGTIIGVYFLNKLLRVPELYLIVLGLLCTCTGLIIQGLAYLDWHLYLAAAIKSLGSVLSPMIRSIMSKIIPPEEIGKVFSVSVALESLISLVGSPVYTAIYDLTIDTCPGAFNFVTAGVNFFNLILTVIVIVLRKHQHSYLRMETAPESTSINS